ncbi:acyl-CoA dehydrogenase family protein [Marinivivus vitaminiproducens]|uniref:acyl-CoA dehydrogenase family protein n=1 Tax=Marinivivus vitaminiproducens TaxID=3035935 RepID=UPI002798E3BB|nr:acyl-CoA dehydrogenase family protein [Geminicoccaceae bacterium SCSIO 64248]
MTIAGAGLIEAARPDLRAAIPGALAAAETLLQAARDRLRARLAPGGRVDPAALEREQHAAHGLAWLAVHVEALRQMAGWAGRLDAAGTFGALEGLILQAAFGEYLGRMAGGIAMSQGEVVRPHDLGLDEADLDAFRTAGVRALIAGGNTSGVRAAIAAAMAEDRFGDPGLSDDTLGMMAEQFRRFAEERIKPFAQAWHERDELIPIALVREIAGLGVFGLTIPENAGGLGLSKEAMAVVTEELSRGYIGTGSLGTRSDILAELILAGGTEEQQARYLPLLASGEFLPTAVFTEPGTGSDLAALQTRAVRDGEVYRVTGQKTWITHAARADLMAILCRTDPAETGYRGLSILLAEKPRGTEADPFPVPGLTGGEIRVLGYRGMKEYTLSFDGFEIPAANLLGAVEGQGFKQLMATFESARIQTAARALGVARDAMELGLAYAQERTQFGKTLTAFPRVHGKLAWMAVEIMIARQLALFAAREKDSGRRCDLEAGYAKLLAAQVAWMCADNALQIHGGNGYALEYPISRVLCDARILNIFEGAAEIQAQVIARRLLEA